MGASWSAPLMGSGQAGEPGPASVTGLDLGYVPGGVPWGNREGVVQRSLADVNGDALPDMVKVTDRGVWVRFNLGYGFTPGWETWTRGVGFESGESYSGVLDAGFGFATAAFEFSGGVSRTAKVDFARYTWADVNADGLLDGLYRTGAGVMVRFGTGAGLAAAVRYGNTAQRSFDFVNGWDAAKVTTGQQIRQDTSIGWGGGADVTIPIPLCSPVPACYLIVNPGGHAEGNVTVTDVDLRDVNGDGYLDSVARGTGDQTMDVRLNTQGRTGLLKTITTPLGGVYTLDYGRAGNTTAHPGPVWVMSSVTVDDAHAGDGPMAGRTTTTDYSYSGLRYDFIARQSIGFGEVVTRQLAAGPGSAVLRTLRDTYSNNSVYDAGLPLLSEVYDGDYLPGDPDGNRQRLASSSVNTWTLYRGASTSDAVTAAQVAAMSPEQRSGLWVRPLVTGTRQSTFYGAGSARRPIESATQTVYDRLGNPVRVTDSGDPDTTADDQVTDYTYSTCATSATPAMAARCGLPGGPNGAPELRNPLADAATCPTWVSVPVTVKVYDAGRLARESDASPGMCGGRVSTVKDSLGGGAWVSTRYGYDAWGNPDRVVSPAAASGRSYAVRTSYDPATHTTPVAATDYDLTSAEAGPFLTGTGTMPTSPASVGVTASAVYDARSQRVTARTDPNGQTTGFRYDGLGRLVRLTLPADGTGGPPGAIDYEYARRESPNRSHRPGTGSLAKPCLPTPSPTGWAGSCRPRPRPSGRSPTHRPG